ncbi:uncharacterized protein LOC141628598 [Silene latifolia]|uniref:uncharacterized protein LOC141628598 n=1 Tax=Silene latifolia TaxID=37657 RepID=UPI003D76A930
MRICFLDPSLTTCHFICLGTSEGKKVKRILIDGGSEVNLMPKATMNELGTTMDEVSNIQTMIHGFNLNGERAVGMIRVNLTMGELSSDTLFYVMDGKTSFKLLLGQSWKHENGVVTSTLHQCLNYYRGGERKIDGDAKPFSKVDSFFADAKFFEENGTSGGFMPTTISSTGKGCKRENNIIKEASSSSEENIGIFDSNAYKLLAKAGYDFTNPTLLGKVIEVEPYGLNKAQQELFKQEGTFIVTKPWHGYESPTSVKIGARRKGATTSSQHITVEEVEENEEGEERMHSSSVFDRISPPAEKSRPSIFIRMGRPSALTKHTSVFVRLGNQDESEVKISTPSLRTNKKGTIHERLGGPSKTVFSRLGATKKIKPALPSSRPYGEKKPRDLEVTTSSYHITVEEIPDENEEVEADEAPKTLEDGGQSTVNELKELNLGTTENPRPIYNSALLTKEEEEEYYKLLVEYKDIFTWSYKEMPGLSPKVAVHRLEIKKGINPKKQSQRRFRSELVPEIEKEVNKLIVIKKQQVFEPQKKRLLHGHAIWIEECWRYIPTRNAKDLR